MSEWHDLDLSCKHCGGQLRARWVSPRHGFVIKGAEPSELIHANGERFCTVQYAASAYDGDWAINKALKRAERAEADR